MKKLIIFAALALVSIAAQSATITWSASAISATSATSDRSTYMAYLFDADISDYSSIVTGLSSGNIAVVKDYIGSKGVSSTGAVTMAKGTNSAGEGDYVTCFAIILDATNIADAKNYMAIGEMTSTKAVSSAGTASIVFGSQAGNTWQAMTVPEPTSGLLILLGMAGLALRRKQA